MSEISPDYVALIFGAILYLFVVWTGFCRALRKAKEPPTRFPPPVDPDPTPVELPEARVARRRRHTS